MGFAEEMEESYNKIETWRKRPDAPNVVFNYFVNEKNITIGRDMNCVILMIMMNQERIKNRYSQYSFAHFQHRYSQYSFAHFQH